MKKDFGSNDLGLKQYTFDAAPLDVANVDFWESVVLTSWWLSGGPSKALKQSVPWCVAA